MRGVLVVVLCLAGCTSPIGLKNPRTGEVAQCGPYANTWETHYRESQCVQDFKEQGYVRVN